MIVVIDDIRSLNNPKAIHLRTEIDALESMNAYLSVDTEIDELWLDHDLGLSGSVKDGTTRSVALLLAERGFYKNPAKINKIYIHTANPVGREWLYSTLKPYYNIEVIPEADLTGLFNYGGIPILGEDDE
jgi:hypothetical protein